MTFGSDARPHVLVTGGAGYIGSHTTLELLTAGYDVTVLDNLSNASSESLRRVGSIVGGKINFWRGDVRDGALLDRVFGGEEVGQQKISAVVHFAALKSAPESVDNPLDYYNCNVSGTISLLTAMSRHNINSFVFSSTAAVYGTPQQGVKLIPEQHDTRPENPYGRSKLMVENIIRDVCTANKDMRAVILRYFNPVGAHESGIIGESPRGTPGNLVPYVLQTVAGQRSHLNVTGLDWPTVDGSGVRDFIHVVDLAKGHVAALSYAKQLHQSTPATVSSTAILADPTIHPTCPTFNMGTGSGSSVLQLISTMESVTGLPVPWVKAPRRPGDVAEVVANPAKANGTLGWEASLGVEEMCRDAWRWKSENMDGYDGPEGPVGVEVKEGVRVVIGGGAEREGREPGSPGPNR
ncbi:hypothetical protein HK097_008182 [Rhizophlyctis rosea]|uniref:NAD-dependent epimerase/dehydratase domain-containing protein n=1 Tax=Rhizophlyctis rosea TaxID=64517 RepID=A0AAD5X171_9FUNG|nr:hypothetical protein HK097_008182 [Rhizophlyctis rosea]